MMTTAQILNRYPAFLVTQKDGVHTPWPGPACVNQQLQPVSIWGGFTDIPQPVLDRCLAAEMAAAAT